MGKIVLGSGGIFFNHESDPLIDHIFSLIDTNKENMKMVYIPTASFDTDEDETIVNDYCTRHGFKEIVHLYLTDETLTEEYIRDTILSATVIFARGGNLKFLLETWRRTKADIYLKQAFDMGIVLGGVSSGAMCWARRGYDDCGLDGRFMFLDALDLVPYIVCPHFSNWPSFLEDVKMQELDGIGIDDDIIVSIVDSKYSVVSSGINPEHSAYYLPASDEYKVHDLMKEKIDIKF